ncbi:Uma2 family endonuclease [Sphaerospermopsis sp. LEGE 08334]|jgi:Uma2 family endonuclease|uniref:Uma2 family endonuclease n=1 Tax=Sphaerospermopsis sp. LEGE 08334 TaxID=1828651 RepID=UPI00187E35D3|nr:Uma2 family endonuclease [Sphaerospermopsis sp. LEGE 08334]MBE9056156.1 Uma2 family endonuclease [Sphaerospermopsis sp. LEGE 08334]
MTSATNRPYTETSLPDHTQLPEINGTNWQKHPQSILLTQSIKPVLQKRHPEGQYTIGQDCGIYWRITDPPERGAESPDWFYVPNVPPLLNGQFRRSYVLWQEYISPLIALEFVSGNGEEERDKTPWQGKFWIYEQVIKPAFYGIYEVTKANLEVYELIGGQYQLLPVNERGHYPITPMGVEIGLWQGEYQNVELPWLRWWDLDGNLLLDGDERAEQERQKSDRLIAQLRALGVEPEI